MKIPSRNQRPSMFQIGSAVLKKTCIMIDALTVSPNDCLLWMESKRSSNSFDENVEGERLTRASIWLLLIQDVPGKHSETIPSSSPKESEYSSLKALSKLNMLATVVLPVCWWARSMSSSLRAMFKSKWISWSSNASANASRVRNSLFCGGYSSVIRTTAFRKARNFCSMVERWANFAKMDSWAKGVR